MPTRLRTVFVYGGGAWGGGNARVQLEMIHHKFVGKSIPRTGDEVKRLVKLFDGIPVANRGALYLLREPRRTSFIRSRWKRLCKYYGIAQRKKKKVGVVAQVNPNEVRPRLRPPQPIRPGFRAIAGNPPDRVRRIPAPRGIFDAPNQARGGLPGVGVVPDAGPEAIRFWNQPIQQAADVALPRWELNAFLQERAEVAPDPQPPRPGRNEWID